MAGNKLTYEQLLTIVQEQKDEKAYQALTHIGPPPWENLRYDRIHQNYVDKFGGGITRDGKMVRKILLNLLTSKEYTLRSEEHTSELQSRGHLVCRLLLENKNNDIK